MPGGQSFIHTSAVLIEFQVRLSIVRPNSVTSIEIHQSSNFARGPAGPSLSPVQTPLTSNFACLSSIQIESSSSPGSTRGASQRAAAPAHGRDSEGPEEGNARPRGPKPGAGRREARREAHWQAESAHLRAPAEPHAPQAGRCGIGGCDPLRVGLADPAAERRRRRQRKWPGPGQGNHRGSACGLAAGSDSNH